MDVIPTLVGYVLFLLAAWHAWLDARENRPQRLLMLLTLFCFGTLLEYGGVTSGNYAYPREAFVNMGVPGKMINHKDTKETIENI